MDTPYELTNVIGSLHSSGLISLVDAAGLAAIIAACQDTDDFTGVVPLGAAASLEFLAPARGRLVASCALDEATRAALRPVLSGAEARARISTVPNQWSGVSLGPTSRYCAHPERFWMHWLPAFPVVSPLGGVHRVHAP